MRDGEAQCSHILPILVNQYHAETLSVPVVPNMFIKVPCQQSFETGNNHCYVIEENKSMLHFWGLHFIQLLSPLGACRV